MQHNTPPCVLRPLTNSILSSRLLHPPPTVTSSTQTNSSSLKQPLAPRPPSPQPLPLSFYMPPVNPFLSKGLPSLLFSVGGFYLLIRFVEGDHQGRSLSRSTISEREDRNEKERTTVSRRTNDWKRRRFDTHTHPSLLSLSLSLAIPRYTNSSSRRSIK
jgi:hypothetical protein